MAEFHFRMSQLDDCITMKVIAVGEGEIGKTCLLTRFTESRFDPNTMRTQHNATLTRVMDVNPDSVRFFCMDTVGQEQYRALAPSSLRSANCVLLCFDPLADNALESLDYWSGQVDEHCRDPVRVLVATKSDLWSGTNPKHLANRQELRTRYHADSLFTTSALDGDRVDDLFLYVFTTWRDGGFKGRDSPKKAERTETPGGGCSC
jgi:small GTP-binding protein